MRKLNYARNETARAYLNGDLSRENAVKQIEGRLKFYEENYAIKDKQDLLAMCLIEYASKFESVSNKKVVDDDGLSEKLADIEALLSSNI